MLYNCITYCLNVIFAWWRTVGVSYLQQERAARLEYVIAEKGFFSEKNKRWKFAGKVYFTSIGELFVAQWIMQDQLDVLFYSGQRWNNSSNICGKLTKQPFLFRDLDFLIYTPDANYRVRCSNVSYPATSTSSQARNCTAWAEVHMWSILFGVIRTGAIACRPLKKMQTTTTTTRTTTMISLTTCDRYDLNRHFGSLSGHFHQNYWPKMKSWVWGHSW